MSTKGKILGLAAVAVISLGAVGGVTYMSNQDAPEKTEKKEAQVAKKSASVKDQDAQLNSTLLKLSSQVNAQLPMMVDSETRLDTTVALDKEFRYMYTLLNFKGAELNIPEATKLLRKQIVNSFCTTEQLKSFVEHDITASYHYYDKDKKFVTKIDVTPSDCKKLLSETK